MTTPAATALARALPVIRWDDGTREWADGSQARTAAEVAARILATDWTPAERAALAAALLTPEVLAEALMRGGIYGEPVVMNDRLATFNEAATAILAALAARGAA